MAKQQEDGTGPESGGGNPLIERTFSGFADLAARLGKLDLAVGGHAGIRDRAIAAEAKRLRRQIREFEPSITMIGQVKAGKTTLVNAMVGRPNLLPADVNPWTSVVTSLHLMAGRETTTGRASFQFFDEAEWNHLMKLGGRVGELASRAGADEEVEKVRQQLEEMRQKSRKRLGRRFEMLLGQSHDYERFDKALIERYVCLGDDFWEDSDGSPDQGRFADITRSADLWLGCSDLPLNLCIRDTPGVNDTFMIREQITIHALRGSRLCVMVLSAQQALSTVDLALIRMISNVKSRDVIIFVNRIDELADPVAEVPEIRASIVETLKKADGPADAEIIFGSGFWANHALEGKCDQLGADSARSLLAWAEGNAGGDAPKESTEALVWHLSGLPALGNAIASRIEAGPGAKIEARIKGALGNIEKSALASRSIAHKRQKREQTDLMTPQQVQAELDMIEHRAVEALSDRIDKLRATFLDRVEKSRQTFLGRASASLLKHLESYGDGEVWSYDASGLRILLRSAYQVFVRSANRIGEEVFAQAAADLGALYGQAFDLDQEEVSLDPPAVPQSPPPVALGQTIALDLRGSWWTRFWRRARGYQAFIDDFSRLIYEETGPIVSALKTHNTDPFEASLHVALDEFICAQRAILTDLSVGKSVGAEPGGEAGGTGPDAFVFSPDARPRRKEANQ